MKSIITATSIILLGLTGSDALIYNGTEIESRIVEVAEEVVTVEQKGDVVEAVFPWKGESGITVKYNLGSTTFAEQLADKRKQEVITESVQEFDGGFKVDVLLNEKPDTNVFCYTIEGHENYDFFYQPELTPEDIAEGAERAPEIVGSYAVYHKALKNNQYQTGKFVHIPRPQVWQISTPENKEWADLSYDSGELCVTVSQDFLDKAEYPVRVDPTFGYGSVGASILGGSFPDRMRGGLFSSPGGATIDSISMYMAGGSGGNIKGVMVSTALTILTDGITPGTVFSSGAGWKTATYSTSPTTASGFYYVSIIADSDTGDYYYDTVTQVGSRYVDNTNSYSSPADPTGTTLIDNQRLSIYATYTGITNSAEIEVLGGGGGGGVISGSGGGGGGGGEYRRCMETLSVQSYTVTVGVGGTIDTTGETDSSFSGTGISMTADGGNGSTNATAGTAGTGGSSTNCDTAVANYDGGTGGAGNTTGDVGGGGGGGAGYGGKGGNGAAGASSIGGGGGGGAGETAAGGNASGATGGSGGTGGGGGGGTGDSNGSADPTGGAGSAGTPDTYHIVGGGGGGGGDDSDPGGACGAPGAGSGGGEVTGAGNGCRGEIRIIYVDAEIDATGGTETTSGDFRIHTFTTSGTFTVNSITGGPTVVPKPQVIWFD